MIQYRIICLDESAFEVNFSCKNTHKNWQIKNKEFQTFFQAICLKPSALRGPFTMCWSTVIIIAPKQIGISLKFDGRIFSDQVKRGFFICRFQKWYSLDAQINEWMLKLDFLPPCTLNLKTFLFKKPISHKTSYLGSPPTYKYS